MHVRFMQRVDYWVGFPACLLLSFFMATARVFSKREKPESRAIKRALFIELSEMGSAILAYPSIVEFSRRFPEAEVYFLIFKKNAESVKVLRSIPDENIITIDDTSFIRFALSSVNVLRLLGERCFDVVFDLELFSRFTAILSLLCGAPNRVGFHNYTEEGLYRGNFLTHPVYYNAQQHMSLNFLALVASFSGGSEEEVERPLIKEDVRQYLVPLPRLAVSSAERRQIRELLVAAGASLQEDSKLVIINPDPGLLPLRGWGAERFGDLARQLTEGDSRILIIVTGLPRAAEFALIMRAMCDENRVVDFSGRTETVYDLVKLFSVAQLLISIDSGPAHFAALTDIKSVVLFGPETPQRYRPLGDSTTSLYARLACSPCYSAANHRHSICRDNQCMKAISVEQVVTAAIAALDDQPAHG